MNEVITLGEFIRSFEEPMEEGILRITNFEGGMCIEWR